MFSIFDVGIILILIMFFIVGIKRGVIKEVVSLVGIILVFVLSFTLKDKIGNWLCVHLPFIAFKGNIQGLETMNIFIYQLIAFIIIFSVLLGVYSLSLKISKFIQKIINMTIILWIPSKILGGVVSLIKGYIISFVIILFLMIPFGGSKIFQESTIVNFMLYNTPVISDYAGNFIKPFKEVYELGTKMSKKDIDVNEANLESLDIMLKYKVIDKKTVEKLIKIRKIDDIEEIDKILEKY